MVNKMEKLMGTTEHFDRRPAFFSVYIDFMKYLFLTCTSNKTV